MVFWDEEKQETTEGAPPSAPSTTSTPTVEELTQALEAERQRAEANLAGWQRAAADLSNYRKRSEQERSDLLKAANAGLISRLLPVLDDLDRAFQTLPDNLAKLTWVEGIMLIDRKLRTILEQEGLSPFDSLNQEFDPVYHEAVMYEETDPANDGKVIAELQKGYRMNDRVLRPALVKVGRGRKT